MPNNPVAGTRVALDIKKQQALSIDFLRRFKSHSSDLNIADTTASTLTTIEHLIIDIADANFQIEERLLWKIIQFLGINNTNDEKTFEVKLNEDRSMLIQKKNSRAFNEKPGEGSLADSFSNNSSYYKTQINHIIASSQATKYSFNKLQINTLNLTLSVYKTSKLSSDLLKIKQSLGIPLIQFENAKIECKPFILMNEHDTAMCILNLITKHYTHELRSHAIRILGSVDFLGNPLGLMVDFKESVSNVLSNGQVTDFVFSITHGFADSFSKFSGSLSDELDQLTMDERHRETREQIRTIFNNGSIDHFVGGALGFAVGVVGGALSLVTQTYRGFNENGVSGAVAGIGRGAVGTFSKPIVGALDLANGIASAIRETSKTTNKMEIPRIRESRCCATPGSLLAPFSRPDANGQKILYQVNNLNLNEKFIALEQVNHQADPLIVSIINQ